MLVDVYTVKIGTLFWGITLFGVVASFHFEVLLFSFHFIPLRKKVLERKKIADANCFVFPGVPAKLKSFF